jgi:hypothetical protein
VTASSDDQQELEKEIEQTRERLGGTVEAVAAKVDVKARAQEKLGQAKQQATRAGQQIRKRPIPAAATAGVIAALVLFFTLIRRWMRRDK